MGKRKSIEPRVYSAKNVGLIYDAIEGQKYAIDEIGEINCFVPWEDFRNMQYMVAFLFFIGRLTDE